MAAPTIDSNQGYLGYRQGQAFEFQPGISANGAAITSVTATGLPTGASVDATTGKITFLGTVGAGSYDIGVQANNASGASAVTYFFVVIVEDDGSSVTAGGNDVGIDIDIDTTSRRPALLYPATATTPDESASDFLFFAKSRDVTQLNLRFKKNGVQLDPNPTSIRLVLKEFEGEGGLEIATTFAKVSAGATAYFKLVVDLTNSKVLSALSNYEKGRSAEFLALAEIEWKQTVSISGVSELVTTTRTFNVLLSRDLTPD